MRRGKSVANVNLQALPLGCAISDEKATDIFRLLAKHFGDDWRSRPELRYYVHAIEHVGTACAEAEECACVFESGLAL